MSGVVDAVPPECGSGASSGGSRFMAWCGGVEAFMSAHSRAVFRVVLLLVAVASVFGRGFYENDQWFILANGRYVLTEGFPHENPFSAWGGFVVLENWGWSALCWVAWELAGATQGGLWLLTLAVVLCMCGVSWRIAMDLTGGMAPAAAASALVMGGVANSMLSVRPSVVSMMLSLVAVWLVLEHMRSRSRWPLLLLPVVAWVAFNMHMTMGWYVVLAPGCWMLSDVLASGAGRLRRLGKYAVTVLCQVAVMFVNPWGVDGVLFLFRSYGAAKYRDSLIEMRGAVLCLASRKTCSIMYPAMAITVILLAMTLLSVVLAWRRLGAATCLGVVFLGVGLGVQFVSAVRGAYSMVLLVPFAVAPLIMMMRDADLRFLTMAASVVVLFGLCLSVWGGALPWNLDKAIDTESDAGHAAQLVMRRGVPHGSKVSCDGWLGTRLTYMGYLTSNDMRPELLSPGITGLDEDYNKAAIDALLDEDAARRYVKLFGPEFQWWMYRKDGNMDHALAADPDMRKAGESGGIVLYENTAYGK